MIDEDVDGSLAHVSVLEAAGLLSTDEARTLRDGLERVRAELRDGSFVPDDADEDVHMAVERRLTEIVGEVGGKLHTARSRNDQVATDVRLWIKRRGALLDAALQRLILALLERVERDGRTLVPGYTHLQRGQPILLGHQLLAHGWALERDRGRLRDALARQDRSPLGACALAGTPHPIDRALAARELGFAGVADNAMDAVAARDHQQEIAAACAICAGHLSRMAEELVLWSSSEFRFVRLADDLSTGSSIMPQKRNPDTAELVRGKSARVQAAPGALLALTRGLPLAYNRDLQEDRETLFDAVETTIDCVEMTAAMWETLTLDGERFERELSGSLILATELADLLAAEGLPFREAHGIVARLAAWCDEHGSDLAGVPRKVLAGLHPALDRDLAPWLDPRAAAERRTSHGGTAWTEIERQVAALRGTLG
jgi:argininosuccinate lyase